MLDFLADYSTAEKHVYRSSELSRNGFYKDMSDFWICLLRGTMSARKDRPWNRVVFERWVLDGYINAYAYMTGESLKQKGPRFVLHSDYLSTESLKIQNSDDEEYSAGHTEVLYVQADNSIRQAYRKNGALPYLKEALLMSEFFVYITRNDDYETRSQIDLIF
jgi:hypothetical protein